jgi:transcriptional regulator NrdR family protein
LKCPACGLVGYTKIVFKRDYKWTIHRRRWCKKCGYRFNTYEATEEEYFRDSNRVFKKWSPGEEKMVVALYMQGLSNREIGEKVGRSTIAIRKKIARLTKDGTFTDYSKELEG